MKITNHARFARVFKNKKGKQFTTHQIEWLMKTQSDINHGSIRPNDHGEGNLSDCSCVKTKRQIFKRLDLGIFEVLDFSE